MSDVEAIASVVVDCGFQIHKDIGPGLFESVYEVVFAEQGDRDGIPIVAPCLTRG